MLTNFWVHYSLENFSYFILLIWSIRLNFLVTISFILDNLLQSIALNFHKNKSTKRIWFEHNFHKNKETEETAILVTVRWTPMLGSNDAQADLSGWGGRRWQKSFWVIQIKKTNPSCTEQTCNENTKKWNKFQSTKCKESISTENLSNFENSNFFEYISPLLTATVLFL
jgi:hypothetical protein